MIVKDIRYIIKRIIIGVGIALILMLIKGNLMLSVNARTISSYSIGNTVAVVDNLSSGYSVTVNGSPWAGYGDGYLYVNFSLFKVSGASTDPNVGVRTVKVFVGSASYTCSYGSNTSNNSTFVNSSYSAVCPVYLDSNGVSSIWVGLQDNQQNSLSQYRLTFDSNITFEQKSTENDYNSILGSINANANANAGYTQNAINSASSSITNNQNQNSQAIINNQNQIAQQQEENQKVCFYEGQIPSSNYSPGYVSSTGRISSVVTNEERYTTNFIKVNPSTRYTYKIAESSWSGFNTNNWIGIGEYSSNSFDSYVVRKTMENHTQNYYTFTTSPTTQYVILSARGLNNAITQFVLGDVSNATKNCKNGNQALAEQNQQLQNTINDTNTDDAENQASNFFTDFTSDTHGLSGVITAPLSMLQALTTATCNPLVFQLPFTHDTVTLPCMKAILQDKFGVFFTLWQLITTGLISYNVCLNFYSKIRDLQNPNSDRIEVLNL